MDRIALEKATLSKMILIYCKGHKHEKPLCGDCHCLLTYAEDRLEACPFGSGKSFCSKCAVHCYEPDMRGTIKSVMRYAGPRMLWNSPLMAIRHILRLEKQTQKVGKR